ncbi:hypothetical protein A2V80_01525 [Candidatus Woesebacteria bacterium RBG_16_39_8b]|uniref:Regulatory protein RecX n=1 Tax=Candidatus Woesebacteria bacterium RBG_16_39_8b TaxID=1802482 RepID=A0A1F7XCL8_9BACT|nr:MAG: hypothetical protein A2V80_01525 [Candidatus Woesebacteria bacterium RBG_16_39_8b]
MPIITSIKPQKNQKRVNIYLDDKFGFGLDLENFVKLGLRAGQEISDGEIEEIIRKSEFQITLDKLLRYATLRPRSEGEFKNWLRKHKVHTTIHKRLFNRLKRLELLDDTKFAKWWVGQRLQFKFTSKKELEYEFKNKGIDRYIIEDTLSEVNIDEEKFAKGLLEKRKYRWEKLPKLVAKKKMTEFLGRKGFDWEIIKKVTKDINT